MTEPTDQTTDLDEWRAFLTRFGIGFTEDAEPSGAQLKMSEGNAKVAGYSFFLTIVEFDAAGRFIQIGAWE